MDLAGISINRSFLSKEHYHDNTGNHHQEIPRLQTSQTNQQIIELTPELLGMDGNRNPANIQGITDNLTQISNGDDVAVSTTGGVIAASNVGDEDQRKVTMLKEITRSF